MAEGVFTGFTADELVMVYGVIHRYSPATQGEASIRERDLRDIAAGLEELGVSGG